MRNFKLVIALSFFLVLNSWALIGIGGHWSPSTAKLKSSNGVVFSQPSPAGDLELSMSQEKISSFHGFGLKLWLDLARYVNFEVTSNINFSDYASTILIEAPGGISKEIPLELQFDEAFVSDKKAKPIFSSMIADLTYYISVVNMDLKVIEWNINLGGGVSYFYTTPVIGAKFTKEFLSGPGKSIAEDLASTLLGDPAALDDPSQLAGFGEKIAKALVDEGINHGFGGHLMLGTRLDMPVIDLYANSKFYFGGQADAQYDNGFVFELGAGLGF